MFSPQTGFSEDEWAKLNEWLDFVYEDFTAKVARARAMSREAVHEVARGRVWTGADAAERGLVDELGGLRRAVEIARERAGLPDDAPLRPVRRCLRCKSCANRATATTRRPSRRPGQRPEPVEWGGYAALAEAIGLPAGGPLLIWSGPLR